MFRTTSRAKPVLFAALLALGATPALAQGVGNNEPISASSSQHFAIGEGRLDVGAQAYPTTAALGADMVSQGVNQVTRV